MDINKTNWRVLEKGRTPQEAWALAAYLRKRHPKDTDLANYEHELYMRYKAPELGVGSAVMPPGYYLAKKFFQQNRPLEYIGRSRLGGLLDEPFLDDNTTPASLGQMWSGLLGTYRGFTR